MSYDALVALVRESAAIDTHDHALDAVSATAQVLVTRLHGMSLTLGPHLSEAVRLLAAAGVVEDSFSVEVFYERVAVLEGRDCRRPEVREHARATVRAFRDSVGQELERLLAHLPPAYADLLGPQATRTGSVAPPRVPAPRRPVHDEDPRG